MKKIISHAVAKMAQADQTKSKVSGKVYATQGEQPEIRPVENDEVFNHLFLDKYKGLTVRRKIAA